MGDTYGVSRSAGLLFRKRFDHFVVDKLYTTVHLLWGSHTTVAGALLYVTGPAKIDHVSAKKLPIFSVFAVP